MGFWPDVRRIIAALPASRQTLLFSATMPDDVVRSAFEIVREPKFVQVGAAQRAGENDQPSRARRAVGTEDRLADRAPQAARRPGAALLAHEDRRRPARAEAGVGGRQVHRAALRSHDGSAPAGRRRFPRRASTTCSSRPTSPRAASTSTASTPSSTTKCRTRPIRMCTAWAGPDASNEVGKAITLVAPEEQRALAALEKSVGVHLQ